MTKQVIEDVRLKFYQRLSSPERKFYSQPRQSFISWEQFVASLNNPANITFETNQLPRSKSRAKEVSYALIAKRPLFTVLETTKHRKILEFTLERELRGMELGHLLMLVEENNFAGGKGSYRKLRLDFNTSNISSHPWTLPNKLESKNGSFQSREKFSPAQIRHELFRVLLKQL